MTSSVPGTRLDSLPREDIKQWMNSFDTVLTDCDGMMKVIADNSIMELIYLFNLSGVLWLNAEIIGDAPKVVNRFKEMGKGVFFVTNNSTKTRGEFVEKAHSMNFNVGVEEIISPSFMAAQYLVSKGFDKEVYIIGSNGIARELDAVNIPHYGVGPDENSENLQKFLRDEFKLKPNVGAVIVGFDEFFNYKKMVRAVSYLERPGCLFIGTNTDERFPTPGYILPGTGSIVKAVETAAERKPVILGKPFSHARDILVNKFGINPERTLMIGDRCNTDILFGKNCGFKTLLVETGIHKEEDVRGWIKSGDEEELKLVPDYILPSLTDLLKYME